MNMRNGRTRIGQRLSVPLLRPNGDQYVLDRQIIGEIFCGRSVAEAKAVIINMCGVMHCGKSLNLNHFYEFLLGTRDSHSSRKSNPPRKCFDWANGIKTQRKTIGMHITKKPILIRRDGQDLAIFLLDCEGTDLRSGNVQTFLFTLSTLLSSVQIINVVKDIQDRDVYALKSFISAYDELNSARGGIFETQLLFLVRDSTSTMSCKLGDEDGPQFLSKTFRMGFKRTIHDKLRKSFSDVSCFILPHPGSKATVRQLKDEFSGAFQELNESFVFYLQRLMDRVLTPDNLVIKRVNGKQVTCREFGDYIEACYDALSGVKDLCVGLLKLASHTRYKPLVEECGSYFKQSLEQEIQGIALDEVEFSEISDEKVQDAIQKFMNATAGRVHDDQKERYQTILEQDLHEFKNEISRSNDRFYNASSDKNETAVRRARRSYEREFQNMVRGQRLDHQTVKDYHELAMNNALAYFNRTPKQGGQNFIQKFRENLHSRILDTFRETCEEISFADVLLCGTDMIRTAVIGVRGGQLDHDACSIGFQNGTVTSDTELSIKVAKDTVGWPEEEYIRRSPVLIFEPSDCRIRKPVKCQLQMWYIAFSQEVFPEENVYVLQKRQDAWIVLHNEVIANKSTIDCNLTELSPVALAISVREKKRQLTTVLYLNTSGNFIAKFYDMSNTSVMNAIRESAKSGRYLTVVDTNTLEISRSDEIIVSLGRCNDNSSAPDTQQFRGEDVYSPGITKSIQFVSPTVPTNENATTMFYEVKINGQKKISNPFKVDLNNPGRPDTAAAGPFTFNRTHAIGDYISIVPEGGNT
ncbi:uncharacterized protein LOC120328315 [Styela clava]